ncbi:MAG: rRNA methyltransferase [Candidatus Kapaibacterium sp.]|nr:MAG: rRNA methyltransferase [Candidatus Kapabacteria bacterium]
METLPPLSNARLRSLLRLHHRRHRDEERLFLAEGIRTVRELLGSTYQVPLLICTERAGQEYADLIEAFLQRGVPCFSVSESNFARLADTKTPQGLLAVVAYPDYRVEQMLDGSSWIALDGISDPGNAGTIVRTALWFGYRAIALGAGSVDRFQPKFVRATMGALFHLRIVEVALETLFERVRSTHRIIGATSRDGIALGQYVPPAVSHVLVIGSEAHGLSPSVEERLDDRVTIEGSGAFDSLNAAVAAGIVMYHLHSQA